MRFGDLFRSRRMALGLTLRKFCLENGLDPGNISRLERGLLQPPQDRDKLESYARLLNIEKESGDWYEFFDLAAAETGRIPEEIMQDSQLVQKLPLLFRTLRGEKVPDDRLDELVRRLREE